MDRYQKVDKPKPEPSINENEIRVTTQGIIRNYISYAASLLQEKAAPEISLKAMGQAISKTVVVAEILKRRVPGLHQNTVISSTSLVDVWEPIEEGLLPLQTTRHVSMISITLSRKELDKSSPGYQAPLPVEQMKHPNARTNGDAQGGRGVGRGRGRGRGWATPGWVMPDGYYPPVFFWGRGRGKSHRGGRGRQMNMYDDSNGFYSGVARGRRMGRGRSRGAAQGRAIASREIAV